MLKTIIHTNYSTNPTHVIMFHHFLHFSHSTLFLYLISLFSSEYQSLKSVSKPKKEFGDFLLSLSQEKKKVWFFFMNCIFGTIHTRILMDLNGLVNDLFRENSKHESFRYTCYEQLLWRPLQNRSVTWVFG